MRLRSARNGRYGTLWAVQRRDFVRLGGVGALGVLGAAAGGRTAQLLSGAPAPKADITLRIAPVLVELAPTRVMSTVGYNGTAPGPVLRMREGQPVTVEVINDTDVPELVHWHGLLIPPEVDGSEEEGTPAVGRTGGAVSIHAAAGRHALVSHPYDGRRRPAPGRLHRSIRFPDDRFRQRSGALRPGSCSWHCATGSRSSPRRNGHRRAEPEMAADRKGRQSSTRARTDWRSARRCIRSTTKRSVPASRSACSRASAC